MCRQFVFIPILLFYFLVQLSSIEGHGRLMDPVARGSRWRLNNSAPADYDDNQGYCGGFGIQWGKFNGKCGLCGNPYSDKQPRAHELGGKYGQGVIVKEYVSGGELNVTVVLTANHMGNFQFHLCNLDNSEENEECFNQTILNLQDGKDRYTLTKSGAGSFNLTLTIPETVACEHCVLRWTYTAGNRWDKCEDGTSKNGCGPQETFKGCSDISITSA